MKKIVSLLVVICMLLSCMPSIVFAKANSNPTRKIANIVVFGYMSNDNQESADEYFSNNMDSIQYILDGSNGRSFKNYINSISYGQAQIENVYPQLTTETFSAINVGLTEDQAKQSNYDDQMIETLVRSMPSIADKVVDYNNDGYVDNLMIILKTNDTNHDVEGGASLVAHKGDFSGSDKINNKNIVTYNVFGTDRLLTERSGLVAHEFLHTLGYADLYRGTANADYPVYTWSVMGAVSQYPQYPLAYERMYFTNWLTIDEITESTNVTLDTQDNADGNQAYIIKSPLNNREIFVIEYRVRAARDYSKDTLDYLLGGSGIIVYRVNLDVEGLTNMRGNTGIYVFRPQQGQPGYSQYDYTCVYNAYLPYNQSDGTRNSIGSADMTMGLEDGALTFSDGSNSGIEINNVALSSDGKHATCEIFIPNADDYDLWDNNGFPNVTSSYSKTLTIEAIDNVLYSVAFDGDKIYSRKQVDGTWSEYAERISDPYVTNLSMDKDDNYLYLAYDYMDTTNYIDHVRLYKYDYINGGDWVPIATIDNVAAGVDVSVVNGNVYLTYLTNQSSGWNNDVNLSVVENGALKSLGKIETTSMIGQPKVVNYKNEVYVSYRKATGDSIIIQKYNSNGTFTSITSDNLSGADYDVASLNGKLYVTLAGNDLKMAIYDGTSWTIGGSSNIVSGEPKMAVIEGNIFVLSSPRTTTGNLVMYHYENDTYTQEGEALDTASGNITAISIGKNLYLSYIHNSDYTMVVKSKLAKQITPPVHTVDKSALEAIISKASIHLNESYSTETLTTLASYVNEYSPLVYDEEATQREVDYATRTILEALYGLKAYFNVLISTSNGSFTITYDGNTKTDETNSVLSGTQITLNATGNDGYTFVGWFDTLNKRYMSRNLEYSLKATTNLSLKAVFVENGSSTLSFENASSWVKKSVTKTTEEWANITSIDSLIPDVPYRYGYTNGRWVYSSEEILAKLQNGENVTLIPEYDESDVTLPVAGEVIDNNPVMDLYYDYDETNTKGTFILATGYPDNINIESIGVALYYKDSTQFDPTDNFELLLNNKMVASQFSTDTLEEIHIVHLKKMTKDMNYSARGYITYYDEDGNLKTVYSNQINIKFN